MRSRVGISYPTLNADSFGQESETWSTPIFRWARVMPMSGDESEQIEGVARRERLSIVLRGGTNLPSTARLTYRSVVYQVKAIVNNDQEQAMMTVIAERLQ